MMEIKEYLKNSKDFYDITIYDCLESTNSTLKDMAKENVKEGKVIIAKEQTKGRGKMNRSFFSPKNCGLYMSILLKPDMKIYDAVFITAATAVAVAEAIDNISGIEAEIKWVNDVYCKGKKVCGILTESGLDLYSKKIGYSVVGIGINLKLAEKGFPSDILNIAGALFDENSYSEKKRNMLTAQILENLYKYYSELNERTFSKEYKRRSNLLGKEISVSVGDEIKKATAMDIDDDCKLVVKYDDGSIEALVSGDVSIKL